MGEQAGLAEGRNEVEHWPGEAGHSVRDLEEDRVRPAMVVHEPTAESLIPEVFLSTVDECHIRHSR